MWLRSRQRKHDGDMLSQKARITIIHSDQAQLPFIRGVDGDFYAANFSATNRDSPAYVSALTANFIPPKTVLKMTSAVPEYGPDDGHVLCR